MSESKKRGEFKCNFNAQIYCKHYVEFVTIRFWIIFSIIKCNFQLLSLYCDCNLSV